MNILHWLPAPASARCWKHHILYFHITTRCSPSVHNFNKMMHTLNLNINLNSKIRIPPDCCKPLFVIPAEMRSRAETVRAVSVASQYRVPTPQKRRGGDETEGGLLSAGDKIISSYCCYNLTQSLSGWCGLFI